MIRGLSFLMILLLVTLVACGADDSVEPKTPRATTLYVDAVDSGAYSSIMAAVEAAAEGDTILLADGVYTAEGNIDIDFGKLNLVLRSESGNPDSCVIRGSSLVSGRGLIIAGNQDERTVIEGITFTRFYFNDSYFAEGAAVMIFAAAPVFRNCVFQGNVTESGGAVHTYNAAASFMTCIFKDNHAALEMGEINDKGGGAVFSVGSTNLFRSCEFIGNRCTGGNRNFGVGGGAIRLVEDRSEFLGCRFIGNSSENAGGAVRGDGGVLSISASVFLNNRSESTAGALILNEVSLNMAHCDFDSNRAEFFGAVVIGAASSSIVERCRFRGNSTGGVAGALGVAGPVRLLNCEFIHNDGGDGGAISFTNGSGQAVTDCLFIGNTATSKGGAANCDYGAQITFRRCIFAGNDAGWRGGALYLSQSDVTVVECTFSGNAAPDGAAIRAEASGGNQASLERCIIVASRGDMAVACESGTVDVDCSDLWGNSGGDFSGGIAHHAGVGGNIVLDPRFRAPEQLDFRLLMDSPCTDAASTCGRMGALPES